MEKNHDELIKQIEYYFSDKNLEYDEFFYSEIEMSPENFISLDILLQCNKVKNMGTTMADLQSAIGASKVLELGEGKVSVRRVDRKLPEFKGMKKRSARKSSVKSKTSERKGSKASIGSRKASKTSINVEEEAQKEAEKESNFLVWILFVPDASELPKNGKLIEETIKEQYKVDVPFARVNKTNAHVVFDRHQANADTVHNLLDHGFEFKGKRISIIEANDREKNFFFRENGNFLEKIIKKKYGKKIQKSKRQEQKKAMGPCNFAGKKYRNHDELKTVFKNLLAKTRNGGEIDDKNSRLLKELLKYHEKSEEKLKECKSFSVDFHPVYKQTRCFFIVREDGTREDFSLHKCLNAFTSL